MIRRRNLIEVVLGLLWFVKGISAAYVQYTQFSCSWVPSPEYEYSIDEVKSTLRSQCIVMIGDTAGARLMQTAANIMNISGNVISWKNFDQDGHNLYTAPHGMYGDFDFNTSMNCLKFQWAPTGEDATKTLSKFHHTGADMIVMVSIGVQDVMDSFDAEIRKGKILAPKRDGMVTQSFSLSSDVSRNLQASVREVCDLAELYDDKHIRIIWVAAPLAWSRESQDWTTRANELITSFNAQSVQLHSMCSNANNIQILDSEKILSNVSFGSHRDVGDSPFHFGAKSRYSQIQALVHLIKNPNIKNLGV